MASYTPRLDLLTKNPVTDGADTFNIETMINENLRKIDSKVATLGVDGKVPAEQLNIDTSSFATKTEFTTHKAERVSDGEVHGMRVTDGKFEYHDGIEWVQVKGDGYPVGNVTSLEATAGDKKVSLKWQDPKDVTVEDSDGNVIKIAKWKGTKILRKTGSYPANENDGVLVIDNGISDQYKTNEFVDLGLVNNTTYYYQAFPYTEEDVFTVDNANRVSAMPKPYVLYGIKIGELNSNPETAVTYTDMAVGFTSAKGNNGAFTYGSWEDKFPFNQIKPCVLKPNLSVNYYLDPNDYTKKAGGGASDITSGADGDVMIEFPKVYWKIERVGTSLHVRYSDVEIDSTYKPLAHTRGVTVKDKCYISAYLGNNISSKLRSLSGKSPTATQTIGAFRTLAKANGVGFDQVAYYQTLMLQVLFLVMFRNRDSQTALGRGYVDGNSASIATGSTNKKGMFYGEITGKQQIKFCGIEDFWGNLYYWVDGFYSDASRSMLIATENFNDTGSGYKNHGQGATANLGGYISEVQGGTETGFVVKATAGSATTHYADSGYLNASCLPYSGGYWADADDAGAFYFRVGSSASNSSASIGARLLAL